MAFLLKKVTYSLGIIVYYYYNKHFRFLAGTLVYYSYGNMLKASYSSPKEY